MMKGNAMMSHLPKALAFAALAGWLAGAAAGARAQPVDLGPGAPAQPDGAYVPYGQPQSAGPVVIYAPPAVPTFTYALLPGHWALRGASYVWVPPERVLRPVQTGALVPGRFAWRDGAYVWVPAHYN
jgi:hypothetical protein